MTPQQALHFLAQVSTKIVAPFELYPQVQEALSIINKVVNPEKPEPKPEKHK